MAGLPWRPVSVEPGARDQPSVRAILRVVVTVVAQRRGAVPRLPRARAARLARAGHLPRRRRLRPGQLPGPSHAPGRRGGAGLPGDRAHPDRDRLDPPPAGDRAGGQAREQPPLLRARAEPGVQREPAAAGAEQGLRHHQEAGGRRPGPGLPDRRGRRRAGEHRRGSRGLGVRAGHDPRHEHVHGQPRRPLARRRAGLPAPAPGRADPPGQRPHRGRGRQLRHRRAAPGLRGRSGRVHHARDPRRARPAAARGGHRGARPDPPGGRHARRGDRGRGHAVHRLPDRHDHLDGVRDRLPAVRELRGAAPYPEPGRRARPLHRRRGRDLRRHPVRRGRRAARHPQRRRPADRPAGVPQLPARDRAGDKRRQRRLAGAGRRSRLRR